MVNERLFACNEPSGYRIRRVKPLVYADLDRVYRRLRSSLVARGRELPPDLAASEFSRLDKLYWTVDDVGIIIASEAGDVHIFFWDKRLRGRERLCKAMAEEIMSELGRDNLWTEIPDTERAVIAFAERIGFKEESAQNSCVTLRLRK